MSKHAMAIQIANDVAMFRERVILWLATKKQLALRDDCKLENDMILAQCVLCKEWKERTPENYNIRKRAKFSTAVPGHEALENSVRHPCKTCWSKTRKTDYELKCIQAKKQNYLDAFKITAAAQNWIAKRPTCCTQDERNHADDIFIRAKLAYYLENKIEFQIPSECIIINGAMLMQCIQCKLYKERLTSNFTRDHQRNFLTTFPGHESLRNYPSWGGCCECQTKKAVEKRKTHEGFITRLIGKYKKDGLSEQWFEDTFAKQNGKGPITGMPLKMEVNGHNCVGVHCRDNTLEHTPANTFLELNEANAPQHSAIPCLFKAWTELYTYLVTYFQNTDKHDDATFLEFIKKQLLLTIGDLGIPRGRLTKRAHDTQVNLKHLPSMLKLHIRRHLNDDIKNRGFHLPAGIDKLAFSRTLYNNTVVKLYEQKWRCTYSGVPLTMETKWNHFSFERINEDLPHFTESGELTNIVFICRMFNVPRQLSRLKILTYFLHQTLVPLPDNVRKIAQTELDALNISQPLQPRKPYTKRRRVIQEPTVPEVNTILEVNTVPKVNTMPKVITMPNINTMPEVNTVSKVTNCPVASVVRKKVNLLQPTTPKRKITDFFHKTSKLQKNVS